MIAQRLIGSGTSLTCVDISLYSITGECIGGIFMWSDYNEYMTSKLALAGIDIGVA